ncbi:MAG: glycosyltransferase family 9 protein [Bacteroidales bacterium]|nr:glycosyltransferase family 9 protein [Bacteroidales bacterium]MDG1902166.1 glycosyltransferase family 9 protein [Bacteroidales bacterium]MDG2081467.1 glycosyltransferase family 9 protein [Bacteroidales bacterium]
MTLKRIIISRTDSIGDVVLTLPMAGILKENDPDCKILFLGTTYTMPIVKLSKYVDEFINWDILQNETNPEEALKKLKADVIIHVYPNKDIASLAFKAKIPIRIGTFGRLFHVLTCNKKVRFSRRKSNLHEAQLNLKLLQPLKINTTFSLSELEHYYGFKKFKLLSGKLNSLIKKDKTNIILHPKSKGSAKEWGLNNFKKLIEILPKHEFQIFISGTKEEEALIGDSLPFYQSNVTSLIGELTLDEFISFIALTDGLVAASTGPLHISAALGKRAIGLFSPKKPIHPERWSPIGLNAVSTVFNEDCEKCKKGADCNCISKISPKKIADLLVRHQY